MAMDFQDLFAFVHVARQESFSRAAATLRVAQSALSRRVSRLEHQIGTELLRRHGRGIRLTEAGSILLARADGLIKEVELIERDVLKLADEPTGQFRIALPPTSGQKLAPLIVLECKRQFPRISLKVREGFSGTIHDWIARGEVDIAVLYSPEDSPDLHIEPLIREPLYLVAPASTGADDPLAGVERISLSRIGLLPLILPSRSHGIRVLIDRFAAEHGFHPNIVYEVDGMRTIKGMIEAGLGYTVFSYAGIYEEVEGGTLRAIPLDPPIHWYLSMVTSVSPRDPRALGELQAIIRRKAAEMYKSGYWRGQLVNSAPL